MMGKPIRRPDPRVLSDGLTRFTCLTLWKRRIEGRLECTVLVSLYVVSHRFDKVSQRRLNSEFEPDS
jgi:hypothetical protein